MEGIFVDETGYYNHENAPVWYADPFFGNNGKSMFETMKPPTFDADDPF